MYVCTPLYMYVYNDDDDDDDDSGTYYNQSQWYLAKI